MVCAREFKQHVIPLLILVLQLLLQERVMLSDGLLGDECGGRVIVLIVQGVEGQQGVVNGIAVSGGAGRTDIGGVMEGLTTELSREA